jgi:hypothetical protein
VRLRSGTRRNAGALPRGERYSRLVEAFPVSSNARAHACNQIDSRSLIRGYFVKCDVFAMAQVRHTGINKVFKVDSVTSRPQPPIT